MHLPSTRYIQNSMPRHVDSVAFHQLEIASSVSIRRDADPSGSWSLVPQPFAVIQVQLVVATFAIALQHERHSCPSGSCAFTLNGARPADRVARPYASVSDISVLSEWSRMAQRPLASPELYCVVVAPGWHRPLGISDRRPCLVPSHNAGAQHLV